MMTDRLQPEVLRRLYCAVLQLRSEEECAAFFEDLCTIAEVQDMAKRLDAAVLLDRGLGYQRIAKDAGLSTATISRVNRCMRYGSGGYRTVLDRLKDAEGDA